MIVRHTRVTGVLVTGKTNERYPLARLAVQAWQQQVYTGPRHLIILNDHPHDALYPDVAPPGTTEIRLKDQRSLGALRNLGMDHFLKHTSAFYPIAPKGIFREYMVQWDDDDYSDPYRLEWQVENTEKDKASIFRWEVHCNLRSGQAFANNGRSIRCKGFPGTMMWPVGVKARFPDKGKAEDTEFVLDLKKECGVQVLDNSPTLYFRCYHGHNTWSEKHVMKRKPGSRDLNPIEQTYVDRRLEFTYQDILKDSRAKTD